MSQYGSEQATLLTSSAQRIRVAVIADSKIERERLSGLVIGAREFMLVGSHSTRTAEREFAVRPPDVILGHVSGDRDYERFRDLARRFIDIPSLLIVTDLEHLTTDNVDEAINGVVELLKRRTRNAIVEELRILATERQVSGVPLRIVRAEDREKFERLTAREREVLARTAEGMSIKEIAAHLNRSYGTVASHRNALMGKVGIHDKVGLTRFAIRVGLIVA